MLSQFTFRDQMSRLADAFGESTKDKFDKKIEVYYDVLESRLTDIQLVSTVSHLLKNGDKFPTIKTLLEVGRNFHTATKQQQESCAACDNSGTITAYQGNYKTIFKCPECKNCKANYPVWNKHEFPEYKASFPLQDWNANDMLQVKGLAMFGPESGVFKKAPKAMQDKARVLVTSAKSSGLTPIGNISPLTRPNQEQEKKRQANIKLMEAVDDIPF